LGWDASIGASCFGQLTSATTARFPFLTNLHLNGVRRFDRFVFLHQLKQFANPVSAAVTNFPVSRSKPILNFRVLATLCFGNVQSFNQFVFQRIFARFPVWQCLGLGSGVSPLMHGASFCEFLMIFSFRELVSFDISEMRAMSRFAATLNLWERDASAGGNRFFQ
jgi:hypothetical protein